MNIKERKKYTIKRGNTHYVVGYIEKLRERSFIGCVLAGHMRVYTIAHETQEEVLKDIKRYCMSHANTSPYSTITDVTPKEWETLT